MKRAKFPGAHGDGASNVAAVNSWVGLSYLYLMQMQGAAIADSYWGEYKTMLIGLSFISS